MDNNEIRAIEQKLCYTFNNKQLLVQAFTHSSYGNAFGVDDNERIEFFGDAILEYIASEKLFELYPNCDAGELSKLRSVIVSAEGLRLPVEELGLLQYLQVANGAGGIKKLSHKIEANLYEAVLCAIYLDGGMAPCKHFVLSTLGNYMQSVKDKIAKDYKTRLQEHCQRTRKSVKYTLRSRTGPDDHPTFECNLYIDGIFVGSGVGSSIKNAEQDAAKKIVIDWRID